MHQIFEAHAFHPNFGNEAVSGKIYFSGQVLCFQSNDVLLKIPLKRLVVDLGKGDDERAYFTDEEQPGLEIILPDQSILGCKSVPQIAQIRNQLAARLGRHELWQRSKVVVYFFAACCLIAWLGTVATSLMVRSIVDRVPSKWENEFGDGLVAELKGEMKFVNDTNRVAQLTQLAAPLMSVLPTNGVQYRFHIVKDDEPNAFALPGGHIVVLTGLLKLADRPEQVLGVVAHEVAHVTERHIVRETISSAGPLLIFQVFLGGRGGATGLLVGGSALMIKQGFSQEYEMEADDVGFGYMVKANIDPRGMVEIFRKLKAHEAGQKELAAVPQAFSSHPATDKRINRLERKWNKLPVKTGFTDLNWKDMGTYWRTNNAWDAKLRRQ